MIRKKEIESVKLLLGKLLIALCIATASTTSTPATELNDPEENQRKRPRLLTSEEGRSEESSHQKSVKRQLFETNDLEEKQRKRPRFMISEEGPSEESSPEKDGKRRLFDVSESSEKTDGQGPTKKVRFSLQQPLVSCPKKEVRSSSPIPPNANWSEIIQQFNAGDQSKKYLIFDAIYAGLLQLPLIQLINVKNIPPAIHHYESLNSKDMSALFSIWASKEIPISEMFIEEILARAYKKDIESLNTLGVMYLEGIGVLTDKLKAFQLFTQAATQGHPLGQYNLAYMLEYGIGTVRSETQAATWCMRAALQGFAPAQHNLGRMYAGERGILQNLHRAVEWSAQAAAQGYAPAQKTLKTVFKSTQDVNIGFSLPEEQDQTINKIRKNLTIMKDFYLYHPLFSDQGGSIDIFGSNPYLKSIIQIITSSFDPYFLFIDKIKTPGFCISSIEPAKDSRDPSLVVGFPGKQYSSWVGFECFQAVMNQQNGISSQLCNLIGLNHRILNFLSTKGTSPNEVAKLLVNLKNSNPELYLYMQMILKPYFTAIKKGEEERILNRALEYLKQLKKILMAHKNFTDTLPSRFRSILLETEEYRNSLFRTTYPWFFE